MALVCTTNVSMFLHANQLTKEGCVRLESKNRRNLIGKACFRRSYLASPTISPTDFTPREAPCYQPFCKYFQKHVQFQSYSPLPKMHRLV